MTNTVNHVMIFVKSAMEVKIKFKIKLLFIIDSSNCTECFP